MKKKKGDGSLLQKLLERGINPNVSVCLCVSHLSYAVHKVVEGCVVHSKTGYKKVERCKEEQTRKL